MNTIRWDRISTDTDLKTLIEIINRRMIPFPEAEVECPDYCGNGSPEGVITAVIGSEYMQWDAAAGDHPRWVKYSNDGDTGWRRWEGMAGAAGTSGTGYRIGDGSVATGDNSIAIGEDEDASNDKTISIGNGNVITSQADITAEGVIGYDNSVIPGPLSGDNRTNNIFVYGANNEIRSTNDGVSAGPLLVIGTENYIEGYEVQIVGHGNVVGGEGTEAISGVCIGTDNVVGDNEGCFVCIGHDAEVTGTGSTAVGTHSISDDDAVALGSGAWATVDDTCALGADTSATAQYAIAIGSSADATAAAAIAIGFNAQATVANKMRIGSVTAPIDEIGVMTSTGLKIITMV